MQLGRMGEKKQEWKREQTKICMHTWIKDNW